MYQEDTKLCALEFRCNLLPKHWLAVLETHIKNGVRDVVAIYTDTNWCFKISYLVKQIEKHKGWQIQQKDEHTYLLKTEQAVVTLSFVSRFCVTSQ